MSFCIAAQRVVLPGGRVAPGHLRVAAGRVTGVGPGIPDDANAVLSDGVLAPGLVDLQLNGAFGVDFAEAAERQWVDVATRLTATGCTAFVPTYITAPLAELTAGLGRYAAARPALDAARGAARTLGVHLEGPFLAARRRGAHREELLCDPPPERIDALLRAGRDGLLTYVTLAPERAHAVEAIHRLRAAGVRVAIGHSDATDDVVRAAGDAGATLVTHLYNAQRPLRHRDPGVVGASLADDRLTCGLIADLHHVAPTAVRVAFAAAKGRIALVTDAVAALGMPAGRYVLGGEELDLAPGTAPLRSDGTIAGSALRMDEAVANAVACGVDLVSAIDAATRAPADAIGRGDLGRIEPGAVADLVWLSDELSTRATWVAGRLAYSDAAARTTLAPPTRGVRT